MNVWKRKLQMYQQNFLIFHKEPRAGDPKSVRTYRLDRLFPCLQTSTSLVTNRQTSKT